MSNYAQQFKRTGLNSAPEAAQMGDTSQQLVAKQIIRSGDATAAAYETSKQQEALQKFNQVKKLGPIDSFGIQVVNAELTDQTVVLFDSYGIGATFGYTQGTVTTTTTQGVTYAAFIEMLKAKAIFTSNFDYQVTVSDLQFKKSVTLVTVNADGSQLPIPLGTDIARAESPSYFNPKLLKLDLNAYLDGTVLLVIRVGAGETINLTFNCLAQNKLS